MDPKFEHIAPYEEAQALEAFKRISSEPTLEVISKYFFANQPADFMSKKVRELTSIDEFQRKVMIDAIGKDIENTTDGFTYSGTSNIKGIFLAISNHRDITLDPAYLQYILHEENIPLTEICVGNNLLANQFIEDVIRCNRMITVLRGLPGREAYEQSVILSEYIREGITTGRNSVWIAQREGRTKNGMDSTEQGVLKMLDMSGKEDFATNFKQLNILPVSISYEYEPCAAYKARETLIKSYGVKYVKKPMEDLHSILCGIKQYKGKVHFEICKPLTDAEIDAAASLKANARYQAIKNVLDERISEGFKLWKNNYIAYDMLNEGGRFEKMYTEEDKKKFLKYLDHEQNRFDFEKELDQHELHNSLLEIYANPIVQKIQRGFI